MKVLQAIEATVLGLWAISGILFQSPNPTPPWHIPRCIRHDSGSESELRLGRGTQEASILLLADFGPLVNIVDFIKACVQDPGIGSEDEIEEVGRTVGGVFASVHSPVTAARIHADAATAARLTHTLADDVVWKAAVEPILSRIEPHSNTANCLYDRVVKDYKSPDSLYRQCFALGDFTPGSILMTKGSKSGHCLVPIIVDWEFAQINGRGVNGDMAQFLASLHCELLAATKHTELYRMLSRFILGLCSAYRDAAKLTFKTQCNDSNMQLMRSAFIMHGREMINQAYELHAGDDSFQDMVCTGIWYLDKAKDTIAEFVIADNLLELNNEDEMLIQRLFTAL